MYCTDSSEKFTVSDSVKNTKQRGSDTKKVGRMIHIKIWKIFPGLRALNFEVIVCLIILSTAKMHMKNALSVKNVIIVFSSLFLLKGVSYLI